MLHLAACEHCSGAAIGGSNGARVHLRTL